MSRNPILNRFSILTVSLLASYALGFPEMVRHGYPNCTACHMSPDGGGLLTSYGRSLSEHLLSHWSNNAEGAFLYGAVNVPPWLALGGDIRTVLSHKQLAGSEGRVVLMQTDIEAGAKLGKFQFVGTVGRQAVQGSHRVIDEVLLRRHYLQYTSGIFSLRVGKFPHAFGIHMADHTSAIKRGLGWDQGTETYNVEFSWTGANLDAFASVVLGRPDAADLQREKGLALRSSAFINSNSKTGISYFFGWNDLGSRHVMGPFIIAGFAEKFYLLAEADIQYFQSASNQATLGSADYIRINYEILSGLHAYVVSELLCLDFSQFSALSDAYGLGVQFFPRPHLEVVLQWERIRNRAIMDRFGDFIWLMGHFYL
ncbi:MAG: hypothetical protein HY537_13975 [Deltaproteobacteria bacterium]|nr:hypothetical protein [Deltaproteobacteria bacterium]